MIRVLLPMLLLTGCAHQTTPVNAPSEGKLIFVAGDVVSHRGNQITMQANDAVQEQYLVATEQQSRAQFMMGDGTMLALRPQTRLFVESYFNSDTGGYQLELVQGGLRSVSRSTGRNRVKTPAGTVAISNAHYNMIWCDHSCGRDDSHETMTGLYLGVSEGSAKISNNAGKFKLEAGQYLFLADSNSRPVYPDFQPAALIDNDRTKGLVNQQAASEVNEILEELGGPLPTASTTP